MIVVNSSLFQTCKSRKYKEVQINPGPGRTIKCPWQGIHIKQYNDRSQNIIYLVYTITLTHTIKVFIKKLTYLSRIVNTNTFLLFLHICLIIFNCAYCLIHVHLLHICVFCTYPILITISIITLNLTYIK